MGAQVSRQGIPAMPAAMDWLQAFPNVETLVTEESKTTLEEI